MDYGDWKRLLEPLSLLLSGAASFIAFQRLHRMIKGLPPCEPSEMDRALLERIIALEERIAVSGSKVPTIGKWRCRWRRLLGLLLAKGSTVA